MRIKNYVAKTNMESTYYFKENVKVAVALQEQQQQMITVIIHA